MQKGSYVDMLKEQTTNTFTLWLLAQNTSGGQSVLRNVLPKLIKNSNVTRTSTSPVAKDFKAQQ